MAEVFINNKFMGEVEDPKQFIARIVEERRKGNLHFTVNVTYEKDLDSIYVEANKGRINRPLIVVKDGKSMFTDKHAEQLTKGEINWDDLVKQGVIEYLDAMEEENTLVSFFEEDLTPDHTHLEVHPTSIIGVATALVPFSNFSPGPRVLIGGKNQKQGLGLYAANFSVRMDMDVNLLHTPQKPMVSTLMYELSGYDKHPQGQNIVVAVMSFKGYNMEDASVINKGSIDCGLGRSTYFRPCISEELRYAGGLTDEICIPDKDIKGFRSEHDYRYLEDDGIIYPEAAVSEGDVVIGKTSPPRFLSSMDEYNLAIDKRRESGVALQHGEIGTVDFVLVTENGEGNKLIQVRLREQRIPEIGDKFTSRHGQKGVIGLIVPHSDMPFTSSGIVPDLIFSPHGIPSRMTISHLIEIVGAKVGALGGHYVDGTTFVSDKEDDLRAELLTLGFREDGMEAMYDGETGEQILAKIFVGNMYYLKLRHMVANKIHSRARGPVQLLTRQPTEGRAKEGGLRLGEMEKDTFVAHGASLLLKERFDADRTVVPVCEECGMIAIYNVYKNKAYCSICGENVEINAIELSYAFKLMLEEFKSLGIYPKLTLEDKY
ncbi:DNA-directed RNA polymerase subunit B [Candidatus Woesearchaeota archaeon]|nr:DNA-directed RNA polymerase subunit B [Candidatus Woesearchaeota archaeon]MBT6519366.1 DNA-directed RNA polymerase subunit B [Candidatus Woesearchaeota archaeon]MBT7367790.1 DNA-directed RNA polymerase subunit B [Candidatus Woesearchaeota archaeon]